MNDGQCEQWIMSKLARCLFIHNNIGNSFNNNSIINKIKRKRVRKWK